MFFARLKKLCDERSISPYKACTDVGLNRAAVAKWKKGSKPNGSTAMKLAEYFNVSVDYLLGQDDEARLIQNAKNELFKMTKLYPDMPSGKRLEFLFHFTRFDHVIVAYNLSINMYDLDNWINLISLPTEDTLTKILNYFGMNCCELLTDKEALDYAINDNSLFDREKALSATESDNLTSRKNLIRIAGRDGSYEQRILTDQQYSAIKAILAQMPDASDNL